MFSGYLSPRTNAVNNLTVIRFFRIWREGYFLRIKTIWGTPRFQTRRPPREFPVAPPAAASNAELGAVEQRTRARAHIAAVTPSRGAP